MHLHTFLSEIFFMIIRACLHTFLSGNLLQDTGAACLHTFLSENLKTMKRHNVSFSFPSTPLLSIYGQSSLNRTGLSGYPTSCIRYPLGVKNRPGFPSLVFNPVWERLPFYFVNCNWKTCHNIFASFSLPSTPGSNIDAQAIPRDSPLFSL